MYLNDWSESKQQGMIEDFEIEVSELEGCNILLASYGYECYSGDAFVLFEKDSKLYEVNGSHCSCYGLEDQWKPEETTIEALRFRLKDGTLGNVSYDYNVFANELKQILNKQEV